MVKLPVKEASILKPEGFKPFYPKLESDINVNTVIVGGGICGLSLAYLLKQAGQTVAVIEKNAIGSGTTGHTTGKVTSQHNLVYADLQKRFGTKAARQYGEANEDAIAQIEKIIKAEKIDCGWERADNYVYTADAERLAEFKQEAKVAAGLGLPASLVKDSPLPFKIQAAVRFTYQAHFSAQKYIEGLAKKINKNGSYVFERTRGIWFTDGVPCQVDTPQGRLIANDIVIATNVPTLPLMARWSYCVLEYPHNSYLVAGRPKIKLEGMYISPDKDHYSLLPIGKGKDQTLLVGGNNNIPGLARIRSKQQQLADYAKQHFGVEKIRYRWHARDYLAYDGLPLIGKLYPWSRHIYTATGFKKWGLSQTTVAALILSDLITGRPNPWAELYTPHRISPLKSIPRTILNP